ncbi:hypothetical protein L7F22_005305 [Adiantum nelumboides]|nr:hypothetical protein [Adiantum nelumboides]
MLYGVQVWGPSVDQDSWRAMERPLISMISRMIRAKASVPHAIIRAEVAAPPIEMEALTKSVSFIHGMWNTDRCRYTRSALESSRQLALKGDTSCWYAKTNLWFQRHGFSMDRLPPFQYSLEAPSLPITKTERNRIIRQDLIQLDTKRTWVEPIQELGTKMAFYRGNFLQVSEDGFVTRPRYMDTHLSHGLRCAIGQIRTSSHQLEIEFGRFQGIPPKDRLCKLCGTEPETELHYRITLLRRQRTRQNQRQIKEFFRSNEEREEGKASNQQPMQRSVHSHTTGTLVDRANELGKSRRPRPRVDIDQLHNLLCALGVFPSFHELQEVLTEIKETFPLQKCISFNDFLPIYLNHKPMKDLDTSIVQQAFSALGADSGGGRLNMDLLLTMLQSEGEKMTKEELQQCFEKILHKHVNLDALPRDINATWFCNKVLKL